MISLADLFGYIAISHLIFMVMQLWFERKKLSKNVFVPTFFALTIGGYLLVDAPFWQPFPAAHLAFHVLPFLAPTAFWLFSKWIFDDDFRWKNQWFALLAAVTVLFYAFFLQNKFGYFSPPPSIEMLCRLATQLVSLTFILLGILEALRNREADLVWSRFQFRKIFILAAAALMAMTALVEISLADQAPPATLQLLQRLAILALTFVFAGFSLSVRQGFFSEKKQAMEDETNPTERQNGTPEPDQKLLAQLNDLMEKQEFWRNEGLSIRQLAEKMGVKEYRLRQAINQHLGFRNFNDYLHSYRIRRACELLADPAQRELTVLEIAYQMGYASLAPFNKAFRDLTGTTPTDWRKQHLG
jgi:AraC-like DNA-binding protein